MPEEKENIVKEVCKELNITQKELSEILGVHLRIQNNSVMFF